MSCGEPGGPSTIQELETMDGALPTQPALWYRSGAAKSALFCSSPLVLRSRGRTGQGHLSSTPCFGRGLQDGGEECRVEQQRLSILGSSWHCSGFLHSPDVWTFGTSAVSSSPGRVPLAASPGSLQAACGQQRNRELPCCTGYCLGNLAEQYSRAVKPSRAVDLGSFYWCVSRLGCVRGKLPISRDCASRKGSYWNLKLLPPLQICSFVLSLAGQGRVTSWLSDSFCYSMFRSASSFPW